METLTAHIARNGAMNELDAVGWIVRLAGRVESLHAVGSAHGRISLACILIEEPSFGSFGVFADKRLVDSFPSHHSPERRAGEGESAADDAWALGVALCAALAGEDVFEGQDSTEPYRFSVPSLRVFGIENEPLQRFVDAAFARDISKRFATATEFRLALEQCEPSLDLRDVPPLEDEIDPVGVLATVPPEARRSGAPPSLPSPSMEAAPRSTVESAAGEDDRRVILSERPRQTEAASSASKISEPRETDRLELGPPSRDEPTLRRRAAARPAPKAKQTTLILLVLALFGVAIGVLLYGVGSAERSETGAPRTTARPPDSPRGTASTPRSSAPAGLTASPVPSSSAEAPAIASPGSVAACMRPLFAEGTFNPDSEPDLAFVCDERDARRGGAMIRSTIVHAAADKRISEGMREWALLGWYELAAYAVVRTRCCPNAEPIAPGPLAQCGPLDEAMTSMEKLAGTARDVEDPAVKAALDLYARGIRKCMVEHRATRPYARDDAPQGGEVTVFKKTLARAMVPAERR